MPAQPTVMFTLFALRSSLSAVGALLCLQSSPSAVYTICSLQFMQSSLLPFFSTFPSSSLSLLYSLHSLQSSPLLITSRSTLCSLQTLHPLLSYLFFYLLSYVFLHYLPFMFVCLAVICKFCGMWHVARWRLCIGCGSSSLSASSSRFTFVATKLGPAQLLNSLSCYTADSCCPPECTPTLPCATGRHFDPIHLAHLSKKRAEETSVLQLFLSSSFSLSTSPSPCLLYFR